MLVGHEDDILEATLTEHCKIVDAFYVLDGTVPNDVSKEICLSFDKCRSYHTDAELPRPPYPNGTTCGYRQWPLEQAQADVGFDHWFLELHADEVWTFHPSEVVAEYPDADGFIFPLPCYFPRTEWDYNRPPLEQLKWSIGPGYPEFRMFKGHEGQAFDPNQHFDTIPSHVETIVTDSRPIKHYAYRSPRSQIEKSRMHDRTGFDPDNYANVRAGKLIWDDALIARYQQQPIWRELRCD